MYHFTFVEESIEHDSFDLTESHRQPNSELVQLAEHWNTDPEVVSPNLTGTIFDKVYFVLCNFRSVRSSDENGYCEKLD